MRRTVTVNVDVDVDISCIDTSDLTDELKRRHGGSEESLDGATPEEARMLRERTVHELRRQATAGKLTVTPCIRDYFWRVYGMDV